MTMVNSNKYQMNKKKPNVKPQVTVKASASQRVLHQPASQQMTGTPRTQWMEIDTVVNTLNKLSLQSFAYRNNFRGGGLNRM